jgi:thiol:disulfide interchange protein/DsbC/DsbD-like thiol-disulfide interchange protein
LGEIDSAQGEFSNRYIEGRIGLALGVGPTLFEFSFRDVSTMITVRRMQICFCLLLLLALRAQAAEPHPVQARLLANVEEVAPGMAFHLGVELRMAPEWHTYWRFSGDAGMPTQVEWELPDRFAAGELQWPLPHKYEEAGGLTAYGYADETMLLAEIVPPADLVGEGVRIAARVSWLVCRELCIPGDTTLVLDLPVAAGEPRQANGEVFERYESMVPGFLGEELALEYGVRRGEGVTTVDLVLQGEGFESEGGLLDFYPLGVADSEFRSSLGATKPPRLTLTLRPFGGGVVDTLEGLVVYRLKGNEERRAGKVVLTLRGKGPLAGTAGLLERDFQEEKGEGEGRSIWLYLLLAAVGGMILNLMPCVLPVISLKVLGFVSQAGEERERVRQLGLAFSAGIVVAFLVLAGLVVLIKGGGEQIGWGFQFQYPGFVMGMAGLIFALGLSLFGLFTVNLTVGGLGGRGKGEGLAGSFFNGVLATILATPCTAPFLGTALGFAFAQTAALVWGIFAAIGVGMALPYVLLALEPGWMRFLPKPGGWMEQFKQLMGFLLMGTVLWLLWVLGKQVGVEGVIWTGAFLLCLAVAGWLMGQWVDLSSSRRKRWTARLLALAVCIGGYWFFLAPVLDVDERLAEANDSQSEAQAWEEFSVARVEELLAENRHVFIDFTAEWCWTCKVNEQTVLASGPVRERFAALDVALIKADWTSRNPEITALLRAFGRSGVPLYVIFPAGHPDRPLILPEVITEGLVLEKLGEAESLRMQLGNIEN